MPTANDPVVGSATSSTSGPKTQPRATRKRASSRVAIGASDTGRLCRETPVNGGGDLADVDVEQPQPIAGAQPQMMSRAGPVARNGDVARRERSVSRRPRRPVDARSEEHTSE